MGFLGLLSNGVLTPCTHPWRSSATEPLDPRGFICVDITCAVCVCDFHFHFSRDTHLFIVPLLSCHWHCHLFFLHWYTTMPLANVWFCGPELTSFLLFQHLWVLRWHWPLQPILMLYLRMWKKTNSCSLTQKKEQYSPSHSWVRCTVQCIACFYNTASGNPSASECPWMTFSPMLFTFFLGIFVKKTLPF